MSGSRVCTALVMSVTLAACAAGSGRMAPPADSYERAVPPGVPEARSWGDALADARRDALRDRMREGMTRLWERRGAPAKGLALDLLALSGGGPDGAYAAGILEGWSARGDRPVFAIVTGISVGALIAPLAFVGEDYDAALRQLFTTSTDADVAEVDLLAPLFGALGVAEPGPLADGIADIVDAAFLARVAEAHADGRLLLIGTTNIDAQRPVVWNMGEIARAGDIALFRDVMLASASIPGVFPPVPIEVAVDGDRFTEFHVDGGVTHSVLIGPTGAQSVIPRRMPFPTSWTFHVVQNNGLLPPYEQVEDRLLPIARRSVSTLIRAQTNGDLEAIYRAAREIGAEFRLTFVPAGAAPPARAIFDPAYMAALFESGRRRVLAREAWLSAPPDRFERQHLVRAATAATLAN